jgi:hypothetical protein
MIVCKEYMDRHIFTSYKHEMLLLHVRTTIFTASGILLPVHTIEMADKQKVGTFFSPKRGIWRREEGKTICN